MKETALLSKLTMQYDTTTTCFIKINKKSEPVKVLAIQQLRDQATKKKCAFSVLISDD
jgi:hypothetical protein